MYGFDLAAAFLDYEPLTLVLIRGSAQQVLPRTNDFPNTPCTDLPEFLTFLNQSVDSFALAIQASEISCHADATIGRRFDESVNQVNRDLGSDVASSTAIAKATPLLCVSDPSD